MKRNILAIATAAGVAAVTLLAVSATPASASSSDATTTANSFISAPTGLHNAPSTQAPAIVTLEAGKPVQALCFIPDGETYKGNSNWFRISVDDKRGWVPRDAIGGMPALPRC
jgi:uncharacterized protein YraI